MLPSQMHTKAQLLRRNAMARLIVAEKLDLVDDALGETEQSLASASLWEESFVQATAIMALIKPKP